MNGNQAEAGTDLVQTYALWAIGLTGLATAIVIAVLVGIAITSGRKKQGGGGINLRTPLLFLEIGAALALILNSSAILSWFTVEEWPLWMNPVFWIGLVLLLTGLILIVPTQRIVSGITGVKFDFALVWKWLLPIGAIIFALYSPKILSWIEPAVMDTPLPQALGWDFETLLFWSAVGATTVLAFWWLFMKINSWVSTALLSLIVLIFIVPYVGDELSKSPRPSCNFQERIGFEMGGHHFLPRWLSGTAGVGNNNPRILDARTGVVATLCSGDSGYVKVAPGTHLEMDFTDGFAQDYETIRKLALGEDRGYLIGQFVQAGRDPRADHDPNYDLYRVRVMDHMFGDTTGSGHDSIQVVVRTVPR